MPEFQFGTDFKADFVLFAPFSGGFDIYFVEVEPPNEPLYTKKGIPAARLAGAINQVQAWKIFVDANRDAVIRPRAGKTTLIDTAQQFLGETKPNLFSTRVDCNNYTKITEKTFFTDLLRGAGHAFCEKGTAATLRVRFIEYVAQTVLDKGENIALLFVDEAQRLTENHYLWLMDVYNGLHHHDIDLLTILVGQEQLIDIRTLLVSDKKQQIVDRFMNLTCSFEGLTTLKDLRTCLAQYDREVYPPESDITYTAHYFSEAVNVGWKLAAIAEDLWEEFKFSPTKRPNKRSKFQVPMQSFCRTINYILRVFGPLCDFEPKLDKKRLDEAIKASGFRGMDI